MTGHRLGGRDHHAGGCVAKRGGDRLGFDHVTGRRGRGVRVHVADLAGLHARVRQRPGDDQLESRARGIGLCDVMRIRGIADPGRDGVHGRAALGSVLLRFEHDHASAFTEHESVAALVERPGRALRLVVARRQRAHRRERRDVQLHDRGFGAARQDDIGSPGPDHLHGVADRLGARSACAHRGVHARLRAELDGDPAGRAVRHQHRHGVRGQPLPALLLQRVVRRQSRGHAADAAGHHDAQPLRIDLGRACVRPGLTGSDQSELFTAVQPARLHPVDQGGRIDRRPRRDPGRQFGSPVVGQLADAAAAGQQ